MEKIKTLLNAMQAKRAHRKAERRIGKEAGSADVCTKKDISLSAFWCLTAAVFAAKALLGRAQDIFISVGGAPLDDELMFRAANSISAGEWLGAYDYLTLSKQMLFAVWLALCNKIGLPYLIAGQLLLCCAALAMAWAFAPILKTNLSRFVLFAALAFSPAAAAHFTLRVYRDNIFPAECILCFAGFIGAALRYQQGLRRSWLWLVLAGVGFGAARLTREDGIWVAPFAAAATVITVIFILREKGLDKKLARCAAQILPYGILAACILTVSAINYHWYGVFATSDFSEGSFSAAYGAMVRVEQENEVNLVPVPKEVREKLYANVPALAPLRAWLEDYPPFQNGYSSAELGDYSAGSFYWVLRRAAQEEGIYDNAVSAAEYWQTVADEINDCIDNGLLSARTGRRTSTAPLIRGYHVLPTLAEALHSFVYCVTFRDCVCYEAADVSYATPDEAAVWESYLHGTVNYSAVENESYPYYRPGQHFIYRVFGLFVPVYAVLVPLLVGAAFVLQTGKLVRMVRERSADGLLLWLVLLGVLLMAVLRCAMIAFMEVAAFHIGTYIMYLAAVHPLLIVYGTAGTLTQLPRRKKGECA